MRRCARPGWSPRTGCTRRSGACSAWSGRRSPRHAAATASAAITRSRRGRTSSRCTGRRRSRRTSPRSTRAPWGGDPRPASGRPRRGARGHPGARGARATAPIASATQRRRPAAAAHARAHAGRVLLAGDASGYVDALTGEGMRVGFAQARSAIDAVRSGDTPPVRTRLARGDAGLPDADHRARRCGPVAVPRADRAGGGGAAGAVRVDRRATGALIRASGIARIELRRYRSRFHHGSVDLGRSRGLRSRAQAGMSRVEHASRRACRGEAHQKDKHLWRYGMASDSDDGRVRRRARRSRSTSPSRCAIGPVPPTGRRPSPRRTRAGRRCSARRCCRGGATRGDAQRRRPLHRR